MAIPEIDPKAYLKLLSSMKDTDIDLVIGALALASFAQPEVLFEKYINHFQKLTEQVEQRHVALLGAGADDDVFLQLAAMKHVLVDVHGYTADEDDPDHVQNASLIRVIDRGMGQHIALCILYVGVGEAQGWDVAVLDIPGHFSCRLEKNGQRVIFSPSMKCKVLEAQDIRQLVKDVLGEPAELSADYYEAVSKRELLIMLQNKVKLLQIELEDYEGALQSVEMMRLVDPDEFRLLLDAGVLYARSDQPFKAIDVLEQYIEKAPVGMAQQEAALLLSDIKESL